MARHDAQPRPPTHLSPAWGIAASVAFVAVAVAVLVALGLDREVLRLLEWVAAQGPWGGLWFVLIMAAVVVALLPGVLFTTGAGFVFGVVQGSIYVVLGTTLGATLAFLIARYALGERASAWLRNHARVRVLAQALATPGWKVVMLSRLVPFFPFKLSNYAFGLAPFSLRGFVGGTLLGVIPFSVHNVYLGSIAADIATLGVRNAARTPLQWALYGAGFVVAVVAVIYLARLARRALAQATQAESPGQGPCPG